MALTYVRQIALIYSVQKQSDGSYVFLNRERKPLGFSSMDWVKYEDYPQIAVKLKISPALAGKLSWNGDQNTDIIYLYNDDCLPDSGDKNWATYCRRLEILMKLKRIEEPRYPIC